MQKPNEEYMVMQKRSWAAVLFSLFIALLLVEIIFKVPEESYWRPIFYCLIIVPVAFILIYRFLIKEGIASYHDFGLTKNHIFKNAVIGISLGIASGIIAFIAARYYFNLNAFEERNMIFAIIAKSVAAPIWEEFVFRGIMFSSLLWILDWKKDWPQEKRILWIGFSYTVIAVIFTFGHYGTSDLVIVYFAGIVDTAAFHLTRSLVAPIFTHSIYNLLQILLPAYMS